MEHSRCSSHMRVNRANCSLTWWTAQSCLGCQTWKNKGEIKTSTTTAWVEHAELVIINPLAYAVEILMVKSESRWTALTTALNHPVAKLMIHGWIFVSLRRLSWLIWIILNKTPHSKWKSRWRLGNESRVTSMQYAWNCKIYKINKFCPLQWEECQSLYTLTF